MAGSPKAKWRKLADGDVLKRSSHAVAAIDDEIYLFGGELVARQPKDGQVHTLAVSKGIIFQWLVKMFLHLWNRQITLLTFEQKRSQHHEPFIPLLQVQPRELARHSPL